MSTVAQQFVPIAVVTDQTSFQECLRGVLKDALLWSVKLSVPWWHKFLAALSQESSGRGAPAPTVIMRAIDTNSSE